MAALTMGACLGCTPPQGMAFIGPDEVRSPIRRDAGDDPVLKPPGELGRVWLFAVGISDYGDEELNLEFADDDAVEIAEFFTDSGLVSEERKELLVDRDATRRAIMARLDRLLGRTAANDLVVIYLAMHGFTFGDELHVLPYDEDLSRPADGTEASPTLVSMAVSESELFSMRTKAAARHVVIIADTCHSTALDEPGTRGLVRTQGDPMMARLLQTKSGVALLTASSADQASREGEQWGNHGVFTASVLAGLAGAADTNADGLITIRELFEYARREVAEKTDQGQHPEFDKGLSGHVVLARVPPAVVPERVEKEEPRLEDDLDAAYRDAQRLFGDHPCRAAARLQRVEDSRPDWGAVHHDLGLSLERCGRFGQAGSAYLDYRDFAQPREQVQVRGRIDEMATRQRKLGMALWIPSAVTYVFAQAIFATIVVTSDAPWLATGLTRRNMFTAMGIGFAMIPGIAVGATYHSRGVSLGKTVAPRRTSMTPADTRRHGAAPSRNSM